MVIDQVRNVFEEPNSFVGREHELDELRRFVPLARAVTLCGPGGIGKTRLALRVLAELADDFPDGVWFIELGELRQPDLVVSRVASVIGGAEGSFPGFALGAGNVAAVSALCRSLDGVPLAIELAAAWVRVLSVEQIVT